MNSLIDLHRRRILLASAAGVATGMTGSNPAALAQSRAMWPGLRARTS